MSRPITLSSSKAIAENANNTPSDFTTVFPDGFHLPSLAFKVACKQFEGWHSRFNISAAYGNNRWRYSVDGVSWNEDIIPDGNYSIEELDNYLKRFIYYPDGNYVANPLTGLTGIDDGVVYPITLEPIFSQNRIHIRLNTADFTAPRVDLTHLKNMSSFLGFTERIVISSETGTLVPDVSNGIDSYLLHCDLISNSFLNNQKSDILLTFTPGVLSNAKYTIEPRNLTWVQVNKQVITSIRIYITDQNNNPIDLAGEDVVVNLLLEPM